MRPILDAEARLALQKVVEKLNEIERELFVLHARDKCIADPALRAQYATKMRQSMGHIGSTSRRLRALLREDDLTLP